MHNRRISPRAARQGAATIEMLLVLPLYAVLCTILLTIGAAGLLTLQVHDRAVEQAWRQLDSNVAGGDPLFTTDVPAFQELASLFEEDPFLEVPVDALMRGNVHTGVAAGKLRMGREDMASQLPAVRGEHHLLAGDWSAELPFLPQEEHKRLWLESRLAAFAPPGFDTRAFKALKGGGSK